MAPYGGQTLNYSRTVGPWTIERGQGRSVPDIIRPNVHTDFLTAQRLALSCHERETGTGLVFRFANVHEGVVAVTSHATSGRVMQHR